MHCDTNSNLKQIFAKNASKNRKQLYSYFQLHPILRFIPHPCKRIIAGVKVLPENFSELGMEGPWASWSNVQLSHFR